MIGTQEVAGVDVVVRTMADEARAPLLFRALDSIQSQEGVVARPIVVVNGRSHHEPVMAALRERDGILLHHFPQAAHGHAITVGRRLVTAPYFMYLDDDDYFVSSALKEVVPGREVTVDWDVLITNRYRESGEKVELDIKDLSSHERDPLRGLMTQNWLAPGSSLFRTDSISAELVDLDHQYHSWTHIAFRLLNEGKRLEFRDIPTVVLYADTPGSKSKQLIYHEDGLRVLEEMQSYPNLDSEIRSILDRKYCDVLHSMAVQYSRAGNMRRAWQCHVRSLRPPHTLKYLLFSRKLLFPRRNAQ